MPKFSSYGNWQKFWLLYGLLLCFRHIFNQNSIPLYCPESSDHLHVVSLIYRPLMVWIFLCSTLLLPLLFCWNDKNTSVFRLTKVYSAKVWYVVYLSLCFCLTLCGWNYLLACVISFLLSNFKDKCLKASFLLSLSLKINSLNISNKTW